MQTLLWTFCDDLCSSSIFFESFDTFLTIERCFLLHTMFLWILFVDPDFHEFLWTYSKNYKKSIRQNKFSVVYKKRLELNKNVLNHMLQIIIMWNILIDKYFSIISLQNFLEILMDFTCILHYCDSLLIALNLIRNYINTWCTYGLGKSLCFFLNNFLSP